MTLLLPVVAYIRFFYGHGHVMFPYLEINFLVEVCLPHCKILYQSELFFS